MSGDAHGVQNVGLARSVLADDTVGTINKPDCCFIFEGLKACNILSRSMRPCMSPAGTTGQTISVSIFFLHFLLKR